MSSSMELEVVNKGTVDERTGLVGSQQSAQVKAKKDDGEGMLPVMLDDALERMGVR